MKKRDIIKTVGRQAVCMSAIFLVMTALALIGFAGPEEKWTVAYDIEKGLYGYQDADGNWSIEPNFKSASAFSEGLAAASVEGETFDKTGYINVDGDWVIQPEFGRSGPFHKGYAAVTVLNEGDGTMSIIDRSGQEIMNTDYYYREAGQGNVLLTFTKHNPGDGKKARLIGAVLGDLRIIEPRFSEIVYKKNMTILYENVEFGAHNLLINQSLLTDQGQVVKIQGDVQSIEDGMISYKYVSKKYDNKLAYGYMNAEGQIFDNYKGEEFYKCEPFSEEHGVVLLNKSESKAPYFNKYGMIRADGTWFLTPDYRRVRTMRDGVAMVRRGEGVGYMKADGNWLLAPFNREVVEEAGNDYKSMSFLNRLTADEYAYVIQEGKDIVQRLTNESMSDYKKALVLHDEVTSRLDYDGTYASDRSMISQSVYGGLKYGNGVCEAYAETYTLLLNFAGIEARVVSGTSRATGIGHAWVILNVDGTYYNADPTWNDNGGHMWFLKSDETFAKSRIWDRLAYPAAPKDYQ